MALIRGRNTEPELAVRRLVYGLGYRYRLHGKKLPGRPDLVFAKRRKVIQVHGCFWHQHPSPSCKLARMPKSRPEFWIPKLEGNRRRDLANEAKLAALGWQHLTIWECELTDLPSLEKKILAFFGR